MTEIGIKSGLGIYSHAEIVEYANDYEYEMYEAELNETIGESFIILKADDSRTITFMISGFAGYTCVYKCIYYFGI